MSSKKVDSNFVAVNRLDWESTSRVVWNHTSYKWMIQNFSQYPTEKHEALLSPSFNCWSSKWQLELYPNGQNHEEEGNIGLFLVKTSPHEVKKAKYKLCYRDRKGINHHEIENECNFGNGRGRPSVIKREVLLKECEPDDVLTVYCELSVYENITNGKVKIVQEPLVNEKNNQSSTDPRKTEILEILATDLAALFTAGKICDILLQVGDQSFSAHKVVLAARSKVFAAMFEHEMTETRSNVVNITDLEATLVSDLLQYIYSGSVSDMSVEKAMGLYSAADKYDLTALKMYCAEILQKHLSIQNACDIALLADMHNDGMLIEYIKKFVGKNASLLSSKKWKTFADQNLRLAYELTLAFELKSARDY